MSADKIFIYYSHYEFFFLNEKTLLISESGLVLVLMLGLGHRIRV